MNAYVTKKLIEFLSYERQHCHLITSLGLSISTRKINVYYARGQSYKISTIAFGGFYEALHWLNIMFIASQGK